jgi:hypothetical protein
MTSGARRMIFLVQFVELASYLVFLAAPQFAPLCTARALGAGESYFICASGTAARNRAPRKLTFLLLLLIY